MRFSKDNFWERVIILMDMNCFFAQVEQMDNPYLRNQPVAVTNGMMGSTIITSSYEARAYGVKTGMRLREAKVLCPDLIQAPSRPERYTAISTMIMKSLFNITPDVQVYSIDEAFLDVTGCQSLWGPPAVIGQMVREAVTNASGLTCSVGVSGDKTTAKFAAKLVKPNGLTVIEPWNAEARLANEPVTELSGINTGIGGFLAKYGVTKCGQMKSIPIGILAKRYGNPGRRVWLMAQGKDPEPVITTVNPPKTIGHGKVLPPGSKDRHTIMTYLQHMSEKVASRLRRHGYQSNRFAIGYRCELGWIGQKVSTESATDDGRVIFMLCANVINACWQGEAVWQVQVTALSPTDARQTDFFIDVESKSKRESLNQAMDKINDRYGDFTLCPSSLLGRSEMPNVIAPSWRPDGHRKTI